MDKKLLNKVMKKLASSNVVISPTVKSSSTSLSMQKKPETETSTAKTGKIFAELLPLPLQPTDGTNGMLRKKTLTHLYIR